MPSKTLYDLTVFASEEIVSDFKSGFVQRFHRQACCIAEQFVNYLSANKLQTNGVAKVQITMIDVQDGVATIPEPDSDEDVIICRWPFRFWDYQAADDPGKKELLASSTRDCLAAVAELWGWDADYFGQMYNDAAERDFVFTGVSKASWSDPTSQFRVRVAFNWLLDAIELSALLFKNRSRNELIRKPLGSMVPESGQLRNALTKEHGRWVSPTEFELCTSDFMQKRWSASFGDIMSRAKESE